MQQATYSQLQKHTGRQTQIEIDKEETEKIIIHRGDGRKQIINAVGWTIYKIYNSEMKLIQQLTQLRKEIFSEAQAQIGGQCQNGP